MLPPFEPSVARAQCTYSPGSNTPCVFWQVFVEEQIIVWEEVYDSNTELSNWEKWYEWRTVCEGTRHRADFYVETEGGTLFVNGSKHDPSKVTD